MNFYEYYNLLPDVPTAEQSALAFELFFNSELAKSNSLTAMEILQDISDRQWHTYQLPSKKIQEKTSEYIIQHLDLDDEDKVVLSLQISSALGLEDVYSYISKQSTQKNIRCLIKEFQNEIIDITNPYASLK